jgi:hypothetical protein
VAQASSLANVPASVPLAGNNSVPATGTVAERTQAGTLAPRAAILPAKRLAQTKIDHRIQTASSNAEHGTRNAELQARFAEPKARGTEHATRNPDSTSQLAFVLDWQLLSGGTLPSLILYGTNTYHVTGPVTVNGETRIEGGAVVKFALWNISASLSLLGTVVCDTSEYRPAIFTGQDDNSIGTVLPVSNGTPGAWAYGGGYLYFYGSAPSACNTRA